MDAGSSGTKMKTLYWDASSPFDAPVEIGEGLRVKPGISSYQDDLSKVSEMLPLLEQARLNLKEADLDWREVPLFLGATAGMRMLPTSDRMAIMASIRSFFRENGFRVDEDNWVRVLSSADEGAEDWLTLNLSLKTLDGSSSNKNPVGIIDLGGGSVELTYLSKLTLLKNKLIADIADYSWNLYSQGFLYFGNDQARKQHQQKLASSGESSDPCHPIGVNNTGGMPGSSDPEKCKEAVKSILPLDVPCFQLDRTECSMLGEYLPDLVQENVTFYGIGTFGYVWDFMQLAADADLQDLEDKADLICAMNMTELDAYDPGNSYATTYCFAAIYIIQLLTEAYKLPKEGTPLIVGESATWVAGFFIDDLNNLNIDAYDAGPVINPMVAEVGTSGSSMNIPSWIAVALLVSYQLFI